MTVSKEANESAQRLQMIEQNVQNISVQKQQFQAQLFEIESALKEIATSTVAYKIVGGIMIGTEKDALQKEMQNKRELVELRVETLEKQEKQLKEKAKNLQKEVLAGVKE